MTDSFLDNLDNLLAEFYSSTSDNTRKARIGKLMKNYNQFLNWNFEMCIFWLLYNNTYFVQCILDFHHFIYSYNSIQLAEQDLAGLKNADKCWEYCVQLLQHSESQYSQWWALSTLEVTFSGVQCHTGWHPVYQAVEPELNIYNAFGISISFRHYSSVLFG